MSNRRTLADEWTPNMDATLSSMKAMGCSYGQISNVLRKTRSAVQKRWYRVRDGGPARKAYLESLKKPPPRIDPCREHLAMIAEAHGCGFPYLNVPATYRVSA